MRTVTPRTVRREITKIHKLAMERDFKLANAYEWELMRELIVAISSGRCVDPKGCAAEVNRLVRFGPGVWSREFNEPKPSKR